MATRSKQHLLNSLSGGSTMHGWDVIIALDGKQLNKTLQQDYLIRLVNGNGLGAYSGDFDIPTTDISNHFGNVTLGPVQFDFSSAALSARVADVRLAVTGGAHVQLKSDNNIEKAISISVMGAWSNKELLLKWPMDVGLQTLELDLASCESPKLTWFSTVVEQERAGRAFLEWLNTFQHGEQVSTLSTFNYADNRLMKADKTYARLQPGGADQAALLVFAHFPETGMTSYPTSDTEFPYLIPGDEFSATAMFSRWLIHRAAMGDAAIRALDAGEFIDVYSSGETFQGIRATRGILPAGARSHTVEGFEFRHAAFELPAATGHKALEVTFLQDGALQEWQPQFQLPFEYRAADTQTWAPATASVTLNLRHEFHLTAGEEEAVEGHVYCPFGHTDEIKALTTVPEVPAEAMVQLKHFILLTTKRAILERWVNVLNSREPRTFLRGVKLAADSPVEEFDIALPFDQALFSKVHPAGATFGVVEHEYVVGAGKTVQLHAEPSPLGLKWTLQALKEEEVVGQSQINEDTGLYQAPSIDIFKGSFARLLAIATVPATGQKSTALITVLADEIALNPVIQQCPITSGASVELAAGVANAEGLTWSTPSHGTLEAIPGKPLSRLYKPGNSPVPNKAYVEVEISVSQGGQTGKAWVLVMQQGANALKVLPDGDVTEGKLQLKATVDGEDFTRDADWSFPLGDEGTIEGGLYASVAGIRRHFVLIHALLDYRDEGEGLWEGHIILPLPLETYPTVLQALAR
jgi:hypothetical protein